MKLGYSRKMINSVERSSCYVLILAKDPLFLFHGDNSVGSKMNEKSWKKCKDHSLSFFEVWAFTWTT